MKILEIKKNFEPVLRTQSRLVTEVTPAEQELLTDMLFTMHKFKGIGLAAPQIGIGRQIIVADTGGGRPVKLINPQLLEVKGGGKMSEGCLSVPNCNVEIVRATEIVVAGLNEDGKHIEFKARDLLARVILHEIDHLNGKLIVDYLNLWQRLFRKRS